MKPDLLTDFIHFDKNSNVTTDKHQKRKYCSNNCGQMLHQAINTSLHMGNYLATECHCFNHFGSHYHLMPIIIANDFFENILFHINVVSWKMLNRYKWLVSIICY